MSVNKSEEIRARESNLLSSILGNTTRQGLVYLIGVIVTAVVSFGMLPVYARIFTTAQYGVLSLAILLVSIGNIIVGNWLSSCTTRFQPYYRNINKVDVFYSSILFSMILALAAFLLLGIPAYFLFRGFLAAELQPLILPVAILIALTMAFQIFLTIFRINQEARKYVVFQLGYTCIGLLVGVSFAVFLDMGVAGILWGQVIILFILCAISFKMLFMTGSIVQRSSVSMAAVREFAFYGFPAAASTIGTWILDGADRYVIGAFRGTAEVGLYSMGYSIGNGIILLVGAFMLTATPTLMLAYESENRDITSRLLSQLSRIYFMIGLPAAIGISLLASPVIRLLTTESYYSSFIVVPYVALGSFIYGLCLLSYTGLQIAKKSHIMARNWFLAGAVNIVLNIIFVPMFGYIAAAVTTLVSYIALLFLNIKSSNRYLKWTLMKRSTIKTVLASMVMGCTVFGIILLTDSAILDCVSGIVIGIVAYFLMLLVLKEFTTDEMMQIRHFFNGLLPGKKNR